MNYQMIQDAMSGVAEGDKRILDKRVDPCIETKQAAIPARFRSGERVCGHRLIIWPIPEKRVTAGGIELPDDVHRRMELNQVQAVVVQIGPECWADRPSKIPWCAVGDKVRIIINAGTIFKSRLDGLTYRHVNDLDILSVECEDE